MFAGETASDDQVNDGALWLEQMVFSLFVSLLVAVSLFSIGAFRNN